MRQVVIKAVVFLLTSGSNLHREMMDCYFTQTRFHRILADESLLYLQVYLRWRQQHTTLRAHKTAAAVKHRLHGLNVETAQNCRFRTGFESLTGSVKVSPAADSSCHIFYTQSHSEGVSGIISSVWWTQWSGFFLRLKLHLKFSLYKPLNLVKFTVKFFDSSRVSSL